MSRNTASAYAGWVRRFVLFHNRRHPSVLGTDDVLVFLVHLAVNDEASSSTRNQALSALRFLHRHVIRRVPEGLEALARAKGPSGLPVVLTRDEITQVFGHVPLQRRLPAQLLYGAGLRLTECLQRRSIKLMPWPQSIHFHEPRRGRASA